MKRISKYSVEQKIEAVLDFKNKKRNKVQICKALGLHESGKTLYQWIAMYDDYGEAAFLPKEKNKRYSKELKDAAIKDYINGKGSNKNIVRKYGIWGTSTLENWIASYLAQGKDSFNEHRVEHSRLIEKSEIQIFRQDNRKMRQQLE